MAIADSFHPRVTDRATQPAQRLLQAGTAGVRLGVHDASRVEWSFSVPLPENAPLRYKLCVRMQIPSIVRQEPWEQLQTFTRLDGPLLTEQRGAPITVDALRRGALALVAKLSRASDAFNRYCRLAVNAREVMTAGELEEALLVGLEAAERTLEDGRRRFAVKVEGEATEVSLERELLDEYTSVRFLEMLASSERALGQLARALEGSPGLVEAVSNVESRVADTLGCELRHRDEAGYIQTDPSSPEALERYLERASRLKKHFQEVLFLEAETFQVAERIHHYVAALAAVVASTWAFAWQIALTNRGVSMGSQVSSGIVVLAVVGGIVYASKDRLKEVGRIWVSRKVHRVLGAQRVARYRAPAKRLPRRDVIVDARESFDQNVEQLPDTLNPESGATMSVKVLEYRHRGTVKPQATLTESGVRRVKHVFRYDMSPLFAHLDDAKKSIPVLDEGSHRVRFIDAPRCYKIPITMTLEEGGAEWSETATLVLHKSGLARIERAVRTREDSDPALMDAALEPG